MGDVQYPALTVRPEPMTEAAAVDITRRAVGRPDLPLTVLGMATFRIGADVVDRYRVGRVFLVGDSAHTLPPTGGFGINTGFGDAHNLVWKLSWVLRGVAPDELLDTYQSERRPVAVSNVDWSSHNGQRLEAIRSAFRAGDSDELQRLVDEQTAHVDPLAQDIGFSYRPIPSGKSPITTLVIGARAPHATVVVDGARRTLHDLFEGRLTLMLGAEASGWAHAAAASAGSDGLDVQIVRRDRVADVDGWLDVRYPLGAAGAALIRPDGHVAWFTARGPDDSGPRALDEVLASVRAHGVSRERADVREG